MLFTVTTVIFVAAFNMRISGLQDVSEQFDDSAVSDDCETQSVINGKNHQEDNDNANVPLNAEEMTKKGILLKAYNTDPYAGLLSKKIMSDCVFYDAAYGDGDTENAALLTLTFLIRATEGYSMEIEISKYDPAVFSTAVKAEDMSLTDVKKAVRKQSDNYCSAAISVVCGDYVVSYRYCGTLIAPRAFYNMIVSSDWFGTPKRN